MVWNMGTKTVDFEGSYKDFFEERKIKLTIIKHPTVEGVKGMRISFPLGSSIFRIDSFDNIDRSFQMIVKIFLTYLGDKALFLDDCQEFKINWR